VTLARVMPRLFSEKFQKSESTPHRSKREPLADRPSSWNRFSRAGVTCSPKQADENLFLVRFQIKPEVMVSRIFGRRTPRAPRSYFGL